MELTPMETPEGGVILVMELYNDGEDLEFSWPSTLIWRLDEDDLARLTLLEERLGLWDPGTLAEASFDLAEIIVRPRGGSVGWVLPLDLDSSDYTYDEEDGQGHPQLQLLSSMRGIIAEGTPLIAEDTDWRATDMRFRVDGRFIDSDGLTVRAIVRVADGEYSVEASTTDLNLRSLRRVLTEPAFALSNRSADVARLDQLGLAAIRLVAPPPPDKPMLPRGRLFSFGDT